MEEGKSGEDVNYFHDNNANQNRIKEKENTNLTQYNTTRIKLRNFQTNISSVLPLKIFSIKVFFFQDICFIKQMSKFVFHKQKNSR